MNLAKECADEKAHFYPSFGTPCRHTSPLPLGEVAERSEDGEGESFRNGRKTLSVTCGDSSPKGKEFAAFALQAQMNEGIPCICAAGISHLNFESLQSERKRKRTPYGVLFLFGGEEGIRTLDTLTTYTRFPIVRLRPAQPPLHSGLFACPRLKQLRYNTRYFAICQVVLRKYFRNFPNKPYKPSGLPQQWVQLWKHRNRLLPQ